MCRAALGDGLVAAVWSGLVWSGPVRAVVVPAATLRDGRRPSRHSFVEKSRAARKRRLREHKKSARSHFYRVFGVCAVHGALTDV